jgi:hypothetical protein
VSTEALLRHARTAAGLVSPRHRRWRRFLSELSLDPDRLPRPVEPPSGGDFIICGCPRTGTSLLSGVLYQPPVAVTVMEPWDGMRLAPAELFRSLRREIGETGRIARGKLDVGALSADGEVRWRREGSSPEPVTLQDGYLLGVKWPAFWRYLELLPETRFLMCLRHPLEVIASFKKVGGRLEQGLEYDIAFNRRMNAELSDTSDVTLRRVRFYDYVHSRILPHLSRPNVLTVRFERWFSEPAKVLAEIESFLGADLVSSSAVVKRPVAKEVLDKTEATFVRKHCRTAEALGYGWT